VGQLPVADIEWLPFGGLPLPLLILFAVAFLIILMMLIWTGFLFFAGRRADRNPPEPGGEELFEWIFLVPALNEEVTIRDSVERLEQIELPRKQIVVINDGSDDGTAEVLAGISNPDLSVIERRPPDARKGKAAALNYAFAEILRRRPDLDPDMTIICVVDADGRISSDGPRFVASHFAEPQVGGVQTLVRIYNRHGILTWFQDIEFSIYGRLFQAGRNKWGTPGMGGNGQYNRLSALSSIDTSKPASAGGRTPPAPLYAPGAGPPGNAITGPGSGGPWRDRLTEDQDLGLRLILAGWHMRQDNRATVNQQGLSNLRRLLRQRTRWSQGNLQAMALITPILRSSVRPAPRLELVLYLLTPIFQGIVGVSLVASAVLFATGTPIIAKDYLWWLGFIYVLGFGGTLLGCIGARLEGGFTLLGLIKGVATAQAYAFYSWLLWPVLVRSTIRQVFRRDSWAKTAREQIRTQSDAT
jgi:cellulose synthase/poly-beta-1,6-N-acetylglucosamine synthase-like glycosyltransferase